MKNQDERQGFTLIELLTVIAIIGILAAILIPVVGAVRESAKTAKCQSNIRQSAIALLGYVTEENDGRFIGTWIPGGAGDPWGGGRVYWGRVLTATGFVDDPHVLFCSLWEPEPGDEEILMDPTRGEIWPWAGTYATSRNGLMPANSEGPPAHLGDVAREGLTSRIIMMTECRLESHPHIAGFAGFRAREGPDPRMDYRHQDGVNAAYADGHVERLTRSKVESFGPGTEAPWFSDVFLP